MEYQLAAWKGFITCRCICRFCKAELASFISVFEHLNKTRPDDFDNIQAVESISEEADKEREFVTLNPADEVENGILENRVAHRNLQAVLVLLLQNAIQILVRCISILQPSLSL